MVSSDGEAWVRRGVVLAQHEVEAEVGRKLIGLEPMSARFYNDTLVLVTDGVGLDAFAADAAGLTSPSAAGLIFSPCTAFDIGQYAGQLEPLPSPCEACRDSPACFLPPGHFPLLLALPSVARASQAHAWHQLDRGHVPLARPRLRRAAAGHTLGTTALRVMPRTGPPRFVGVSQQGAGGKKNLSFAVWPIAP